MTPSEMTAKWRRLGVRHRDGKLVRFDKVFNQCLGPGRRDSPGATFCYFVTKAGTVAALECEGEECFLVTISGPGGFSRLLAGRLEEVS